MFNNMQSLIQEIFKPNDHKPLMVNADGNRLVYPFAECDSLYGVESIIPGMPNFMQWFDTDEVAYHPKRTPDRIIGMLRKYVANMTEEELSYFTPVYNQLITLFDIQSVQCHQDSFELSVFLNDEPKVLKVSVFNMTKPLSETLAFYAS